MNGELIQAENKPSSISSIPAGTLPRQLLLPVRAVVRGSRTLLISRNESFTRLGAPVIDLLQPGSSYCNLADQPELDRLQKKGVKDSLAVNETKIRLFFVDENESWLWLPDS